MKYIVGVDEAGRGPLAGPVSVGIVAVAEGFDVAAEFPGVKDSKKLTEKRREAIFALLEERKKLGDVRFSVCFEDARVIDEKGIAHAVRRATWRGIQSLPPEEVIKVWLDGSLKAPPEYVQETVIDGDNLIPIISLASVAAKVLRDRKMCAYDVEFPQYGFAKHKGYGTAVHYAAIQEHGTCAIHRKSFIKVD